MVKYVGTMDLHIALGGLPSHISQGPFMALYIPSFYLTRGGGQLKLLYRVYAHMV
jgi:hypothetical protein